MTDPQARKQALQSCILWNPVAGSFSGLLAQDCDLLDVAMVYNKDNVWANAQQAGPPGTIDWLLQDRKYAAVTACILLIHTASGVTSVPCNRLIYENSIVW
jgi:hypothetical protein